MNGTPKVPRRPVGPLTFIDADFTSWTGRLWRIARTAGPHATPWWQPRAWGPVAGMRWDPHHRPASLQPDRAVLYTASTILTAAVEVWQTGRIIRPHDGAPLVAAFTPTRPLRLLDLTGLWPVRNGASAALPYAPRPVCRTWAQAILNADPDLDGLLAPSTISGCNVVLFPAGASAVPADNPDLVVPASDPAVMLTLEEIASECGYRFDG